MHLASFFFTSITIQIKLRYLKVVPHLETAAPTVGYSEWCSGKYRCTKLLEATFVKFVFQSFERFLSCDFSFRILKSVLFSSQNLNMGIKTNRWGRSLFGNKMLLTKKVRKSNTVSTYWRLTFFYTSMQKIQEKLGVIAYTESIFLNVKMHIRKKWLNLLKKNF